jgi:hypothetical protein
VPALRVARILAGSHKQAARPQLSSLPIDGTWHLGRGHPACLHSKGKGWRRGSEGGAARRFEFKWERSDHAGRRWVVRSQAGTGGTRNGARRGQVSPIR